MAWAGSTRRARLPKDWARTRRRILRRDNHACQTRFSDGRMCGAPANQVDHVVPGDDHGDANLQALCQWCHTHKSSSEGGTAAALTRVRTDRPKPTHPALED
ncbi:5-methylcytosine-specific restriction protein A [Streptomyces sp. LBL]|nr:5-methylcytosine-specific restriction protein A [Streptomyces sp. LBL]